MGSSIPSGGEPPNMPPLDDTSGMNQPPEQPPPPTPQEEAKFRVGMVAEGSLADEHDHQVPQVGKRPDASKGWFGHMIQPVFDFFSEQPRKVKTLVKYFFTRKK